MMTNQPYKPQEITAKDNSPDLETNVAAVEDDLYARVQVIKCGHDRRIRLRLVVENFRLGFYITFIFIVALGVILTKLFVEGDYGAPLLEAFGSVSICVYFDYAPSNYILPSIYAVALLFINSYGIVSIFRVWVAMEEGKVSRASFIGYVIGFVYVLLSFVIFATIFAVSPDKDDKHSIQIHTGPYTNLVVAVWVLAVLVTWYGDKVAWKDIGIPRVLFIVNWVMVGCQSITVPGKLIHHINCLGDLENGLWWNPATAPNTTMAFQLLDYLFLISTILWPTLQSAYLSYKGHQTHCVYLSLENSRPARTKI